MYEFAKLYTCMSMFDKHSKPIRGSKQSHKLGSSVSGYAMLTVQISGLLCAIVTDI